MARKFYNAFNFIIIVACFTCIAVKVDAADPSTKTPTGALSPFGIGSCHQTGQDLKPWLPQMAEIGIPMIRTCKPDQMDYLAEHHMQFGGLLYGVPANDKIDAPGTLPVKDLAAWSAFVTRRIKDAHGRVKYWEVWNEPPNGIGRDQTAADYAKLMVSTYDAARAVDPNCLVGLAAKSVDINWLEQTIKAGAKDHFDYVVLHPYETLGVATDHAGAEPVFLNIVPTVRKMLAAQNSSKRDVPIIFTELGCDTSKGEDHQAHALVKAYTMGIAQGVACIEWFEGMDGDSGPMGLLRRDRTARPAYKAMGQMIRQLGLHPRYVGWTKLNDKDFAFVFEGEKGNVGLAWAPVGSTDQIRFDEAVDVVDPLVGTASNVKSFSLTTAPMLILNPPASVFTAATANHGKPVLWDGDYSRAKSVSVTFGPTNIEKGLHTQSAQSIANDIIAYGGSARAGSVPGGNIFMVDPTYLSYASEPIEIAVTVRRNQNNDKAGFKLDYECTTGSRNLGWYTVPDNKQWHTMKWVIEDAEFVSKYGFNFALDSDGNQYNKYDIQSVVITKIDRQ